MSSGFACAGAEPGRGKEYARSGRDHGSLTDTVFPAELSRTAARSNSLAVEPETDSGQPRIDADCVRRLASSTVGPQQHPSDVPAQGLRTVSGSRRHARTLLLVDRDWLESLGICKSTGRRP